MYALDKEETLGSDVTHWSLIIKAQLEWRILIKYRLQRKTKTLAMSYKRIGVGHIYLSDHWQAELFWSLQSYPWWRVSVKGSWSHLISTKAKHYFWMKLKDGKTEGSIVKTDSIGKMNETWKPIAYSVNFKIEQQLYLHYLRYFQIFLKVIALLLLIFD